MGLEVLGNTLEENLLAKVAAQHTNDGASLQITDVVEDLVNFKGVSYRNFDGMGCTEGVEFHGLLNTLSL